MQTHQDIWFSVNTQIEHVYFRVDEDNPEINPFLEFIPWPIKVSSIIFGDGSQQFTAGGGGGGSQTPWRSNIDADGFSIFNLDSINGVPVSEIIGGAGNPSAPNESVQFNNDGAFGGSPNFLYDAINGFLSVSSIGDSQDIGPFVPATEFEVRGGFRVALAVDFTYPRSGSGIYMYFTGDTASGNGTGTIDCRNFANNTPQNLEITGAGMTISAFTPEFGLAPIIIQCSMIGIGFFSPQFTLDVGPLDSNSTVNVNGCYYVSAVEFACGNGAGGIDLTNISTINGAPPGGGGMTQTPWLSNINAAGFSLTNAIGITISGLANTGLTLGRTDGSGLSAGITYDTTNNVAVNAGVRAAGGFFGTTSYNPTQSGLTIGFMRIDVVGDVNCTGVYRNGGTAGVSGSFTTDDGRTVTVTGGIITGIV